MAVVALLGLGASMVAAAPAAAQDQPAVAPTSQVAWGPCPADVIAGAAPSVLDCGTVSVPLDYAEPDGTRIDLMISRLASTNPQVRRGVLITNPGGPGGSGLTLPALLSSRGLPASVTESYDVIGVDTRGVGYSSPVNCGLPADSPYYANLPPYAVDDAAVLAQATVVENVAQRCAANDPEGRLAHITTANNARDTDAIRAALGEEKTNFLGYSYGSALGAAYASMFPERSDRIVLDSNLADTALDPDGMRRFALGMEQAFPDFARWAADRHQTYDLGRTPREVRATYFALAQRLDRTPLPGGVDGALFRLGTFGLLYREGQYGQLAALWQSVQRSDGAGAARTLRDADRDPMLLPQDNALTVFLAVTCNDVEWSRDVNTYRAAVAQDRQRHPMYGAAAANITPCAFWPYEKTEPQVPINDDGPRNVLLVQNERDAATPLAGARLLREKFADRSRLVTVDDNAHGAYVLSDNACALNTTTRYLVDGEMPRRDVRC